jgi:pimeloyl-ACP methyl ester carboxylesterase
MSVASKSQHTDEDPRTRFRTFKSKDAHTIAYGDYGSADGLALVFLHGSPGSRFEAADHDALARDLGLRLIAPERAGMGRSDPNPGQTMLQGAQNVLDLLDHLNITQFSVAGYSGGAGHLYALRHLAPDRIIAAADIAGFAPVADHPEVRRHLAVLDAIFMTIGRLAPIIFNLTFGLLVRAVRDPNPQRLARFMRSSLSGADTGWLAQQGNLAHLHADVSEACRGGAEGPAQDAALLYGRWGFTLDDLPNGLLIYAADQDRFAPTAFAHWKASQMPSSYCTIFDGVGHFGITEHMPEIFAALRCLASEVYLSQQPLTEST